jgi:hypothetical protein
LKNGSTLSFNLGSLSQKVLWNYIPSLAARYSKITTGGPQTLYLNITQKTPLNLATVNQTVTIGNYTTFFNRFSQYLFYYIISHFSPKQFGYANPTGTNSITISGTAHVLLNFRGQSLWRNVTNNALFVDYNPILTNCTAGLPVAITWNFYNVTNLGQITSNVVVSGHYYLPYSNASIPAQSAGFGTANSVYQTCISPSWAQFVASGQFYFSANNFAQSQYLLQNLAVSNTSQTINVYLQQIPYPSQYEIVVENGTGKYIGALVQELYYNPNTNTSIMVNEFQTTPTSGFVTNLETGDSYIFKVYNSQGQLLNVTPAITASCPLGSVCTYYINVANSSIIMPSQIIQNIHASCSQTNSPGNITTITCTLTSSTGENINATLLVYKNNPIFNNVVCNKTVMSQAITLTCTANQTNNTFYTWQLWINSPEKYEIQTGSFGTQPSLFGSWGIVLALALVLIMALVAVTLSPTAGVILATIGVVISGILTFVNLSSTTIGFLIGFAAILVFVLRR